MKKITCALFMFFVFSGNIFAQDARGLADANNQFAFKLYSQYKTEEGNIFYSPFSIFSALAIVYEGARGETAQQIEAVFHFPKDTSIRRDSFLATCQQVKHDDQGLVFSLANALWVQKDYKLLGGYLDVLSKYYGAKAQGLDFVGEAERSRVTINSWIEEQTKDKIRGLIPQGFLRPLTRLVLTNAVYFKGFWLKHFKKSDTMEEDFWITSEQKTRVEMMHLTDNKTKFNYVETEALQILELPYMGAELSMLILLPLKNDLKTVEEMLSCEKLIEWKRLLSMTRLDIFLPKFKFEEKYFMAKDLEDMGMPIAFELGIDFGGRADFSGMTGNKRLNIGEVIHQAFIEVDEEGTEAAAATAVVTVYGLVMLPEQVKIFKADHPFIFIIQDKATNQILFIGRVIDPTK